MVAAVFSVGMVAGAVRGQSEDCSPLEPIGSFVPWDDLSTNFVFIAVRDGLLYSSRFSEPLGTTDFRVHDVSDPGSPVLVASVPNPLVGGGGDIILLGDVGVLQFAGLNIFQTIDLGDPRSPEFVEFYYDGGRPDFAALAAHGDRLAMGGLERIELFDIGDPSSPTLLGTYNFPIPSDSIAQAGYIVSDGRYVYDAGSHGFGLRIVDFGDPTSPKEVGSVASEGSVEWWWSPVLVDGRLYVLVEDLDQEFELLCIDVHDPSLPSIIARLDMPGGGCFKMVVHDHLAYVKCGTMMQVVDIRDPGSMEIIATQSVNVSRRMVIDGSVLYGHANIESMIKIFSLVGCPECEGDVNGDGAVDVNDISYVLLRLGDEGGNGDANGDGAVDVNDISSVLFRLGDDCPPIT